MSLEKRFFASVYRMPWHAVSMGQGNLPDLFYSYTWGDAIPDSPWIRPWRPRLVSEGTRASFLSQDIIRSSLNIYGIYRRKISHFVKVARRMQIGSVPEPNGTWIKWLLKNIANRQEYIKSKHSGLHIWFQNMSMEWFFIQEAISINYGMGHVVHGPSRLREDHHRR